QVVADVDEQALWSIAVNARGDLFDFHAGFPHVQRLLDVVGCQAHQAGVVRGKRQVVNATPELRPHRALALRREQNDADGFLNVPLLAGKFDASARVDARWKSPSRTKNVSHAAPLLTA